MFNQIKELFNLNYKPINEEAANWAANFISFVLILPFFLAISISTSILGSISPHLKMISYMTWSIIISWLTSKINENKRKRIFIESDRAIQYTIQLTAPTIIISISILFSLILYESFYTWNFDWKVRNGDQDLLVFSFIILIFEILIEEWTFGMLQYIFTDIYREYIKIKSNLGIYNIEPNGFLTYCMIVFANRIFTETIVLNIIIFGWFGLSPYYYYKRHNVLYREIALLSASIFLVIFL